MSTKPARKSIIRAGDRTK